MKPAVGLYTAQLTNIAYLCGQWLEEVHQSHLKEECDLIKEEIPPIINNLVE